MLDATGAAAIPKFFFHLYRGKEIIPDEDGDDLPSSEAAYLQAFSSAQELWALALARRDDPTAYAFEVRDENDALLFSLPLTEVLEASRRGRKRIDVEELRRVLHKHNESRDALIARQRLIQQSLTEQIERTRDSINRTYDLLRALRERDQL